MEPVDVPIYDFNHHKRSHEVRRMDAADVVLVEGILVLAMNSVREFMNMKIFVDTDDDVRLARRWEQNLDFEAWDNTRNTNWTSNWIYTWIEGNAQNSKFASSESYHEVQHIRYRMCTPYIAKASPVQWGDYAETVDTRRLDSWAVLSLLSLVAILWCHSFPKSNVEQNSIYSCMIPKNIRECDVLNCQWCLQGLNAWPVTTLLLERLDRPNNNFACLKTCRSSNLMTGYWRSLVVFFKMQDTTRCDR